MKVRKKRQRRGNGLFRSSGGGARQRQSVDRRRQVEASPPSLEILAATRLGYGISPSFRSHWKRLGSTDEERFAAYVDEQLRPHLIIDHDYQDRRAAAGFSTLDKTRRRLWLDHHVNANPFGLRYPPFLESKRDMFLRAVHSNRQLETVLTEFWLDHFNIYGLDYWALPVFPDWVRMIRRHAFGNFRVMIEEVARHPAMMLYLDNVESSAAGPNENFARELLELHTLGAENYYGVVRSEDVSVDDLGRPLGFSDRDVMTASRAFTGWSVALGGSDGRPNDGSFYYAEQDHDPEEKRFLGETIPAGQGPLEDGRQVLDAVAGHPGTARHIARKLARRLVSDDPPESLVAEAARVFEQRMDQSDQIGAVVETIVSSDAFQQTWGKKVRRPFELAAAAMRATGITFPFTLDDVGTEQFMVVYERAGHELFGWPTPDGYPDRREEWLSTVPRVMAWRFMLWLTADRDERGAPRLPAESSPSTFISSRLLVDHWIDRILARPLDESVREEIVALMANGRSPWEPVDLTQKSAAERVTAMIALILNTPEFAEK